MHSHRRSRAKTLFEVLCALALGASFVLAWDQTGATALLASASISILIGLYWTFGLFGGPEARPTAETVAFEPPVPEPEAEPRIEIFAFEPDPVVEAEVAPPVAKAKPKRKSRKAKTVESLAAVEPDRAEGAAHQEPMHIEQLFDPQPFARQQRPAFGRKSRGPLPAA